MLPPEIRSDVAMHHRWFRGWVGGIGIDRSTVLDVERRDARVLLDELAAWLDLVAHQHREEAVGGRGVVHRDLRERAGLRVHRGLAELVRVHLAEALEA